MSSQPGVGQPGTSQQGQAGGGPQAAFSPNAGDFQYGGAFPPPRPVGGSFFDSIRSSGFYRSEPRVLGGICAGLAARFGWDRTLVRVVVVVLTLFVPIFFAVYGLAWAFLPEYRDGRIHFQTLLQGRFDIAQLGALVMFVIGLGNIGPWFSVFGGTGIGVMMFLTLVIIASVAIIGVSTSSASSFGRSFSAQAPYTASSHGMETPMPTPTQGGNPSPESSADWRTQGGPATPQPSQSTAFAQSPGSCGPQTSGPRSPYTSPANAPSAGPAFASHAAAHAAGPHGAPQGMPGMSAGVPHGAPSPFGTPQPPQTGPYAAGPVPPMGAPRSSSPFGHAPAYTPTPAYASTQVRWAPAPPLKPRVLPAWANLATTGIIVLVIAATLFLMHQMSYDSYQYRDFARVLLIGGGTCLIIVGLVIALASLRDRGAGWVVALSVIGALMAIPTLIVGISGVNYDEENGHWPASTTEPVAFYHWSDGDQNLIVNGELTLTDMPTNATPTIEIQELTGELTIRVRKDQPVEIQIVDMFGALSADYFEPGMHWVPTHLGLSQDTSFRSIEDTAAEVPIVRIHNMLGSLHIVEEDLEESDFYPEPAEGAESADLVTQAPQSATPAQAEQAQSTDRPQSATTPASGQ